MRITYLAPDERLEHELVQAKEEGKSVEHIQAAWQAMLKGAPTDAEKRAQAEEVLDVLAALEAPAEHAAQEPSSLEQIQACCPEATSAPTVLPSRDVLYDRILGGWLGRAAGCLLGKPVEKATRQGIRELLKANNRWPLDDYFTAEGVPENLLARYPWNRYGGVESLQENIVCMPEDDDLNYTMLNLHVLETYGPSFTPDNVLQTWLDTLPVLATFTAERVAYLNALHHLSPPQTASYQNPYREWIGAQIRADLWGWVCPGDPQQAAALAWRDASVSHVKNGIYGEMFIAATLAACFIASHPMEAIEKGLEQIPRASRLAEAIRFAQALPSKVATWEEAVDRLYERYGSYHWVHTVNNTALLTAALAFGDGDFEQSICNTVMGGWDTDSHGATVGAIVGTCLGAQQLSEKWTAPLQNRIRTSLKGFDHSTFDDLARRTLDQVFYSD